MNEQILIHDNSHIKGEKYKEEKIDGKIYKMAPPCNEHIDVQANLTYIFTDYFRQHKKPCRARPGAGLDIDENNSLEPDLQIICREKDNGEIPVIVVEVLSKSTKKRDFGVKMKKYAGLGIREYWILSWQDSSIAVYLLDESGQYELYNVYSVFTEKDKLEEDIIKEIVTAFSPVSFPELVIRLEDVFDIEWA